MAKTDYADEIWKVIPFAPDYALSNLGRLKRLTDSRRKAKAGDFLKPNLQTPHGKYQYVRLWIDGRKRLYYLHQLVALVFIGPAPSDHHQVAHGDGNGLNNCADNLRWATPIENAADKIEHGTVNRGERCGAAKLSETDVQRIRLLDGRHTEIAQSYGVSPRAIADIRKRRRWAWLD